MTTAINAELDAVVGGFSDTHKKMLTPAPKCLSEEYLNHMNRM